MRRLLATSLILLLAASIARADTYTRRFNPWPVIVGGDTLEIPFWGGVNNPKPSLVDFNRDGLVDLMLGDTEGRLGYFRNTGTPQAPHFVPVVERLGGIDIATWHVFADIDNDNDLDLFCDSRTAGIAFYRNDGGPDSLPVFTLVDAAYAGIETGVNSTPALADLDADGDLDFFLGAVTGALEFYRNDGTATNASFSLIDNFYDSVLAFPGGGKAALDPNHGFSSIYFVDLDNDLDLDLFWGDIFNSNMYYFENDGSPGTSDLIWATETFLLEPTKGFNHPRLADLDDDGDPDMILGVANAADLDNLHLLRNLGTVDQPFFTTESTALLSMIDVGSYSQPAPGDIDGDGDLDLLVGGGDGRIQLFECTGSPAVPSYERVTDFLAGIDVGLNAAPALVDWDADGDLDLLIGTSAGRIQYWRNDGSATEFLPVLQETQLGGIKVDQYAVPRPGDLNGDGLTDLLVGEWDFNGLANVRLYANTGSAGAPALTLVTESLLKRQARDYTVPEPVDWNGDGILDIILGGRVSGLTVFAGSNAPGAFPDSITLTPLPDTVASADAGTFLAIQLVDLDGDGDRDILVGEENGGLSYWEKDGSCCVGMRGNVNADTLDVVNIADLTALIGVLFRGDAPLPCALEANVTGDAGESLNILDVTYLVAFLFRGGPPPGECPG